MDMERVSRFLEKHMISEDIPEYIYQYCVFLYYEYLVEGIKEAEKMEYGEVFDEFRVIALVNEMQEAQTVIQTMKQKLKHQTELYDISELVTFPGGYLKGGAFTGDSAAALAAAQEWVAVYQKKLGNPFLFEVGVYILTLLGADTEIRQQ